MSSEENQLYGYQSKIQENQALIKTAERNLADAKLTGNTAKITNATNLLNAAKYNIGVYTAKAQPLIQIVAQQKYAETQRQAAAAAEARAVAQATAAAAAAEAKATADREAATIEGRKKAEAQRALETSAYYDPTTQTASPYFNSQLYQNPEPVSYKSQAEKAAADLTGVKGLESLSLQAYEQSGTAGRLEAARSGEGGSIFETGAGFKQVGLDEGQKFAREQQPISPFGDEGVVIGGSFYEQDVAKETDVKKQIPKFVDVTLSKDYLQAAEIQKNTFVPEANFTSGGTKIIPADAFGIPGLSGSLAVQVPDYSTLGEERFAVLASDLKAKGSVPAIKSKQSQEPTIDSMFGIQNQTKQPTPSELIFGAPTGKYKTGETNIPSNPFGMDSNQQGNLIDQLFGQPGQKSKSKSLPPLPAAGFVSGADIFGGVYEGAGKAVGGFGSFLEDIGKQFGFSLAPETKKATATSKKEKVPTGKGLQDQLFSQGLFYGEQPKSKGSKSAEANALGYQVSSEGTFYEGFASKGTFTGLKGKTSTELTGKISKREEEKRKAAEEKAARAAKEAAERANFEARDRASRAARAATDAGKGSKAAFPIIDKQFQNIFSPTQSRPPPSSKTNKKSLKGGLFYGQEDLFY